MANDEARRQARRDKILNNAENRLHRIMSPDAVSLRPSAEYVGKQVTFRQKPTAKNPADTQSTTRTLYVNTAPDDNVSSIYDTSAFSEVAPYKMRNRLWFIALFALVFRYVLGMMEPYLSLLDFDVQTVHLNKVFVPFLVYEAVDLTFYTVLPPGQLFIFAIVRFRYRNGEQIVRVLNVVLVVLNDLIWYFFCFCCANALVTLITWQGVVDDDD